MNKFLVVTIILGVLIIWSISVYAFQEDKLTRGETIARWNFWGKVMSEDQAKKTIFIENKLNIPDEQRAFPYARIKE